MASIAPSHDHQLGEVEWLWENNNAVDNALAELDYSWPTLFDQFDLIVENALAESHYGSPDLFGWIFEDNTTFKNALAELDHHGSSNQVELGDLAQVQINDFFEDIQMTEASPVILNNIGSSSTVNGRKAKHPRKKPIPWTSGEHMLFLEGLTKYGKGDWRSISRFSVVTRTPAQVASHAQKYFIRLKKSQNNHGNSGTAATNAATPSPC